MLLLLAALLARLPEQPESWRTSDSAGMTAVWHWSRGSALAVAAGSDLSYLGSGSAVLTVRDSTVVSVTELPGACQDVLVEGEYLYVAAGKAGLVIAGIENSERPRVVGSLDLPGYAWGIAKAGNRVAVASGPDGVFVLDVTEPSQPFLISSAVIADTVRAVAMGGGFIYAACDRQGLAVIDASRPGAMDLAARVDCPGPALGVTLKDSMAYVMCGDTGVILVDVARPRQPAVTLRLDWRGALAMQYSDTLAVVVCGLSGAWLVNVGNAASPYVWCYLPAPGFALDVAVSGGRMSIAAGADGLLQYDVTRPTYPVLRGRLRQPGHLNDIAVQGAVGWACMSSGLFAIDLNRPVGADIGFCPLSGTPTSVALGRGFAVVALGDSGLGVVMTADPHQPRLAATLRLSGAAGCVALKDTWAFVSTGGKEVSVVSLGRPEQPTEVARLFDIQGPVGLSASGTVLAIAAGDSGLYFCDVTDPSAPQVVKRMMLPGRVDAVHYDTVTVCSGDSGLFILDTRNVTRPQLLSRTPLVAEGWDLAVAETLCCVASDWVGVVYFNTKDPSHPWVLGYYGGATVAHAVALAGEDPVMADVYSGVTLLRRQTAAVQPAPVRADMPVVIAPSVQVPPVVWAAVLTADAPVRVSLFDLSGRAVAQSSVATAGLWQVVTFPAYPLGAGVFFLRAEAQSRTSVRRIELVR